jgi:hypothetical protein
MTRESRADRTSASPSWPTRRPPASIALRRRVQIRFTMMAQAADTNCKVDASVRAGPRGEMFEVKCGDLRRHRSHFAARPNSGPSCLWIAAGRWPVLSVGNEPRSECRTHRPEAHRRAQTVTGVNRCGTVIAAVEGGTVELRCNEWGGVVGPERHLARGCSGGIARHAVLASIRYARTCAHAGDRVSQLAGDTFG